MSSPSADLRIFNSQRDKNAQHVVVRSAGEQDQSFLTCTRHHFRSQFGVWFRVVAVFEQFDSNHRAQPAYVANLAVGFRDSQQAFTQGLPQIVGFLQQIFLLENV